MPALKYAININGVTQLMMMKADVLSDLNHIKICTHYKHHGELIDYLPFDADDANLEPIYIEMPAWKEDLTKLETIEGAPKELMDYIHYLEEQLETPIKIVSVGPDRTQTLSR